ncbi:MAG: hypothetical protein ACXWV1_04810 [Chitinophagaceae bacterium]
MATLKEIFDAHSGRLVHKWDHYFDIYERYFSKYRDRLVNIRDKEIYDYGSV